MNESSTSSLAVATRPSSLEVAASASAALAKATIEAKFVIALRPENRRDVMSSRNRILAACKNAKFADGARYRVKRGRKQVNGAWVDNYIEGPSIRFAEMALQAWKNVDITQCIAFENEDQRLVRITVTDLENNISYSDDVMLAKTIERKKPKEGQEVIGKRVNSEGEEVFVVRATDEELQAKVNAAKSKSIRNSGLRLIPEDIIEEAMEVVVDVQANPSGAQDPKAASKKLADAFFAIGVEAGELSAYLGHPLESVTPKELAELRSIYSAIKDGEANWADYRKTETKEPATEMKAANATVSEPAPAATTKPKQARSAKSATPSFAQWCADRQIGDADALNAIHRLWPATETIGSLDDIEKNHPAQAKYVMEHEAEFIAEVKIN